MMKNLKQKDNRRVNHKKKMKMMKVNKMMIKKLKNIKKI